MPPPPPDHYVKAALEAFHDMKRRREALLTPGKRDGVVVVARARRGTFDDGDDDDFGSPDSAAALSRGPSVVDAGPESSPSSAASSDGRWADAEHELWAANSSDDGLRDDRGLWDGAAKDDARRLAGVGFGTRIRGDLAGVRVAESPYASRRDFESPRDPDDGVECVARDPDNDDVARFFSSPRGRYPCVSPCGRDRVASPFGAVVDLSHIASPRSPPGAVVGRGRVAADFDSPFGARRVAASPRGCVDLLPGAVVGRCGDDRVGCDVDDSPLVGRRHSVASPRCRGDSPPGAAGGRCCDDRVALDVDDASPGPRRRRDNASDASPASPRRRVAADVDDAPGLDPASLRADPLPRYELERADATKGCWCPRTLDGDVDAEACDAFDRPSFLAATRH